MAFPETVLPLEVALAFDGSTWTTVTPDVRREGQIRITRGRQDWGQQVDAGRCSFVLSNSDGTYSPRNPEGPYYGQIGRNTPVRVSVLTGSVAGWLPGDDAGYFSTPDAAALDITGDLDVRLDATLLNWYLADTAQGSGATSLVTELIGKFNTSGNQRSWVLYTQYGYLKFSWSTDGTGTAGAVVSSTVKLPVPASGRLAVRVTIDVNNGAGGYTVRFYTASTIDGTWEQLGDDVVGGSTTSIFSSTADLRIGNALAGADSATGFENAVGHVHAAEVRNGIGGSLVADPDFTAQTSGATSFADSAGRTWSRNGTAEITNRKVRFVGEVSSWTPEKRDGDDVICKVEASGLMRRLGQGAIAAKSPMYREFTSPFRSHIVAYWPMEDGSGATRLASAFDAHPAMTISGTVTPAAYSDWPASDPLPTVTTGSMRVSVPTYTGTGRIFLRLFVAVPAAGVVSTQRLISFTQSGTARVWSVFLTTAGNMELRAYDSESTQILATGSLTFGINGKKKSIGVELTQDGSDIDWTLFCYDTTDSTLTSHSAVSYSGTLASYTVGTATQIRFGEDGLMNGTAFGHLALSDATNGFASTAGALLGWVGETAAARVHRLGVEEQFASYATAAGDEQMGVQARSTVIDLMRAAGEVDEGILCEQRDVLGIRLVQRRSLYNQTHALVIDYSGDDGLVTPLDPVDDDQSVTNDVTVQRTGGSSSRATLDDGPLSTQPPPDGIGLYDTSRTLHLFDDDQTAPHANWRLALGTVDETRFPQVTLNLAGAPAMIEDAAAADIGSRMQITNPPVFLPPDTVDLLVQGYSEVLDQKTWTITYNGTPYRPWLVGVVEDAELGRVDANPGGSLVAAAVNESATELIVHTPAAGATTLPVPFITSSGPSPTYAAEFPFDLRVAGEVMTLTANRPGVYDAFGRTVASGWGTPDVGTAWTVVGTASEYSVGSNIGVTTHPTVGIAHLALTPSPGPDVDLYVDIGASALATGASLFTGPIVRATDNNNLYQARVELTTTNTVLLTIRKRVAGVETQLATFTSTLTHVAATFIRVRFQVQGSTLRAKVWLASGTEPFVWQATASDSSITATANLGVRCFRNTGNTNASVQLQFDNVHLITPQRMTVARSVNGVSKSQATGAEVRLAQPAVVAL